MKHFCLQNKPAAGELLLALVAIQCRDFSSLLLAWVALA